MYSPSAAWARTATGTVTLGKDGAAAGLFPGGPVPTTAAEGEAEDLPQTHLLEDGSVSVPAVGGMTPQGGCFDGFPHFGDTDASHAFLSKPSH